MKHLIAGTLYASLALAGLSLATPSSAHAQVPWKMTKTSWSQADEKKFSEFVSSIYESGCNTVPKCMAGSGNWYASKDPKGMTWYADCGRFPYLLRSYFAFHNGLPFQSAIAATQRDPNDPNSALQYTSRGNVITKRMWAQNGIDAYKFIKGVVGSVFSAVYRVDSRIDVETNKYGDMHHVKISREFIRPGTVVYDPNGHVATVAKVTNEGKVILLDSHPDNSVSRVPYTGAFRATSPSQSGGFKNWRPVELKNGQPTVPANADTPGFSLEQFTGDQPNEKGGFSTAKWKTSDGILDSKQYIDVVRARLSVGNVSYDMVKEVGEEVETLCTMVEDRVSSVATAIKASVDKNSMPDGRLPMNIYGTSGEWEEYSTPSRDARLKTAAAEFHDHVVRMYTLYKARDVRAVYNGTDVVGDMLKAFDDAASRCNLSYVKSDGRVQKLAYQDVIQRLYAMSFDPYHCVEMRWGASDASELASCNTKSGSKLEWYKAEQRIRNSLERKYEKKMGWSLTELQNRMDMDAKNPDNSAGSDTAAPLDVRAYLLSIR